MNDFDLMRRDGFRLAKAVIALSKDSNKALRAKVRAATVMFKQCETVNQLEYACDILRTLFKVLDHREPDDYEILDFTQGQWGASVRHSPQTGSDGAEWRRNVDSVNERAQGVSVSEMASGGPDRCVDGRTDLLKPQSSGGRDTDGLAGPLQPQQKRHRAIRRKTKDRLREALIGYYSEIKKID